MVMMKSIRLYERVASLAPAREGMWRCAPGPTKRADHPESASATCAVTKRPRGPIVGQLVDTFTVKSVLVPRFRLRHKRRSRDAEDRHHRHAKGLARSRIT